MPGPAAGLSPAGDGDGVGQTHSPPSGRDWVLRSLQADTTRRARQPQQLPRSAGTPFQARIEGGTTCTSRAGCTTPHRGPVRSRPGPEPLLGEVRRSGRAVGFAAVGRGRDADAEVALDASQAVAHVAQLLLDGPAGLLDEVAALEPPLSALGTDGRSRPDSPSCRRWTHDGACRQATEPPRCWRPGPHGQSVRTGRRTSRGQTGSPE